MAISFGKKGKPCPACGRDWDDVMFLLECGCALVGHSGSAAAQHIASGKSGTLACDHGSQQYVLGMVTLNDPTTHEARDA